jgi:hypothetical protein
MSLTRLVPSLTVLAFTVGLFAAPSPARAQSGLIIDTINLEGVAYDAVTGVLTATGGTVTGTFAGLPFTTDIEDFAIGLLPDDDPSGGCSILNLELAPIDLDLLGLHVDTSAICLELTAFPGEGLLGDLLCGLAGGNLPLLEDLLGVLPDILTESMAAEADAPGADAEDICDGECEILDLALGPVDLTLLGLNVYLHNCEDGPVQVCVSASAGEGLLGDLLCGLAGGGILPDLGNLEALVGTILDALGDADLTPRRLRQLVNRLVSQIADRLEDGNLSDRELDRVTKTINQALR